MNKKRSWGILFLFFFSFFSLVFSGYVWKDPVLTDSKVNYWINSDGKDAFYITENGLIYKLSLISGSQQVLYNSFKSSTTPLLLIKQNLIFGTEDGEIYAYSLQEKKIVWTYSLKKKESNLSAQLMFLNSNQNLIAAVYDKKLVVLKPESGSEVFSKYITNGKSVVLSQDKIFLIADKKIYAYGSLGQLLWFAEVGELFKTNPVFEPTNNILLVPSASKGILFAFDASSGSLLWFYFVDGFLMSEPLTDSSTVFFGTNSGEIIGLNLKTGEQKYKNAINQVLWGRGQKLQDYVFYTSSKGEVVGFNIKNGEMVFKHNIGLPSYYPSLINQKTILLPTTSNRIYYLSLIPSCSIFSPQNGQEIGIDATITGSALAFSGAKNVQVFVNKKPLPVLNLEGNFFSIPLDLTSSQAGEVEIECLATDAKGEIEKNELGYKIKGLFSEVLTKAKLYAFIEPSLTLEPGQEFLLYIQNQYSKNLNNVTMKYLNQGKIVNSPYKLIAPKDPGVYKISIQKEGYENKEIYFEVKDVLFLIKVFLLAIIVLIIYGLVLHFSKARNK